MQYNPATPPQRISPVHAPRTRRQHREAMSHQGDDLLASNTMPENSEQASQHSEADLERRLAEAEAQNRVLRQQIALEQALAQQRMQEAELARLRSGNDADTATTTSGSMPPDQAPPNATNNPVVNPPADNQSTASGGASSFIPRISSSALPRLQNPTYDGKSFHDLTVFIYDLEYRFQLYRAHFPTEIDRIQYAVSCLRGTPKDRWVHEADKQLKRGGDPYPARTWQAFTEFLTSEHGDERSRSFAAAASWAALKQEIGEKADDFFARADKIINELSEPLAPEHLVSTLAAKLLPDINSELWKQQSLPTTRQEFVSYVKRLETSFGVKTQAISSGAAPTTTFTRPPTNNPSSSITCYLCGKLGHYARNCATAAPSQGLKCYTCNKEGHLSRNCPNTRCQQCGQTGHSRWACRGSANSTPIGSARQRS